MLFPAYRSRRLRQNELFRKLIRETTLSLNDLVMPLFVVEGKNIKEPISSMPGQYHFSVDRIVEEAQQIKNSGIPAVILFGIPAKKDALATSAYIKDGVVQRAITEIKKKVPGLLVFTDVCMCQYTDHGHCGVISGNTIENDVSIEIIAKIALSHATAGADLVAPSDMMDGRVGEIRDILDEAGFENIPIMSYAAKYCSSFYGPFRGAVDSSPSFGDRKTYQMDPANVQEAIREATMDVEEGADIIMVKPALAYLDVISRLKDEIDLPIAAYSVSGEYAMIKAAEKMGWLDGDKAIMETLLSMKRAGADILITYFAMDAAKILQGNK